MCWSYIDISWNMEKVHLIWFMWLSPAEFEGARCSHGQYFLCDRKLRWCCLSLATLWQWAPCAMPLHSLRPLRCHQTWTMEAFADWFVGWERKASDAGPFWTATGVLFVSHGCDRWNIRRSLLLQQCGRDSARFHDCLCLTEIVFFFRASCNVIQVKALVARPWLGNLRSMFLLNAKIWCPYAYLIIFVFSHCRVSLPPNTKRPPLP